MEVTRMELTGLAAIDPLDAQNRRDLLGALNGLPVEGAILRAAIVDTRPPRLAWFSCRGGCAFALDRLAGEDVRIGVYDTGLATQLLEAAEPILRAIEAAIGIELEPEALEGLSSTGEHHVLRIEVRAGAGTILHRLHLVLPSGLRITPTPAPFAPDLLTDAPLPVTIVVPGPRLSPHDAADLGPGDLVLLGPGPLSATLRIPARAPVAGRFDPAARLFAPAHVPIHATATPRPRQELADDE